MKNILKKKIKKKKKKKKESSSEEYSVGEDKKKKKGADEIDGPSKFTPIPKNNTPLPDCELIEKIGKLDIINSRIKNIYIFHQILQTKNCLKL